MHHNEIPYNTIPSNAKFVTISSYCRFRERTPPTRPTVGTPSASNNQPREVGVCRMTGVWVYKRLVLPCNRINWKPHNKESGSNPEYPIRPPSGCVEKNLKVSSDLSPFQITYKPESLSATLDTIINSSSPSFKFHFSLGYTNFIHSGVAWYLRGCSYI